jgi:hypothetical protein
MRHSIVLALAIGLLSVVPSYAQNAATLGLIEQGVGAAESFGSMAASMAAQRQAYEQQQEILKQQRQMMEQQRQAQITWPCPSGYHHAAALLADGSKTEVCIRNGQQ